MCANKTVGNLPWPPDSFGRPPSWGFPIVLGPLVPPQYIA